MCEADRRHRARLDRIAQCSARAVRLEHRNLTRFQARIRKRRTEHALLRLPIRSRQARTPPILPNRAASQPYMPLIARSQTARNRVNGLAACVPISAHVKCMAATPSGYETGNGVATHRRRTEYHVDSSI